MKQVSLLSLILGLGALPLPGAVTELYTYSSLNQLIPAGDASGVALTYNLSSDITSVTSVRVSLDISSDSNGSLYAYLTHDDVICILLNRAGRTTDNLAGYDDNGLNITFDDSLVGRDIHLYHTIDPPTSGSALTGSWHTDARDADPDEVTDLSSPNADLNAFSTRDADGNWTLFVASLESGGTTTLNGWSLEVTGVPEPMTCGLITGLLLLGFAAFRQRRRCAACVPKADDHTLP